MKMKNSQNNCT